MRVGEQSRHTASLRTVRPGDVVVLAPHLRDGKRSVWRVCGDGSRTFEAKHLSLCAGGFDEAVGEKRGGVAGLMRRLFDGAHRKT